MASIISREQRGFTLALPVKPRGQERARVVRTANGTRAYTPTNSANAQREIRELWMLAGRPAVPDGHPFTASIAAVFRRPKSHTAKRAPQLPRPDVDNIGKLVLDALQHHAFADDAACASLTVSKAWGDEDGITVSLTW